MARHYFNTVENSVTGKPVNGATIEVLSAALAYVTIYSDDGTTTIDQSSSPLTSDSTGFFQFWTNETSGTVRISYDGEVKRTITDVEFPDGAVSGDVTAIAARMDAAEVITQDPLIVDIAALSDPNADRILFWDDSVGDIGWLAPSTGLTITGTNMTVDPVAAAGLADPNADRIRFWDDSAGAEAWLAPDSTIAITGTSIGVAGSGTGSPGSIEIATASASANIIQITGLSLSSYDALEIDITGVTVNTDDEVRMQLEIAGSLATTGYKYTVYSDSTSGTDQGSENAAATGINLTGTGAYALGSGAGKSLSGSLFLSGPGSSNYKQMVGNCIQGYTGANHGRNTIGGTLENTGVVTGLKIYCPTNNITAGKARLLRRG